MAASRLPWVIPEYCEGCTSCTAACPQACLTMRDGADESLPHLTSCGSCTGCGRCADACGLGGIVMTAHVDEARSRFEQIDAASGVMAMP